MLSLRTLIYSFSTLVVDSHLQIDNDVAGGCYNAHEWSYDVHKQQWTRRAASRANVIAFVSFRFVLAFVYIHVQVKFNGSHS